MKKIVLLTVAILGIAFTGNSQSITREISGKKVYHEQFNVSGSYNFTFETLAEFRGATPCSCSSGSVSAGLFSQSYSGYGLQTSSSVYSRGPISDSDQLSGHTQDYYHVPPSPNDRIYLSLLSDYTFGYASAKFIISY